MNATKNRCVAILWLMILLLANASLRAEDAGQAALDEATEVKLTAENINDLGGVIRLCHQALEAGLDKSNTEFAQKLLAGTLLQRAEFIVSEIFDSPTPPSRWPQLRQLALSDLEESLEVNADEPEAHWMLARLQALPGGDRPRAVKAVEDALRLTEKDPPLRAKTLVLRASLSTDLDQRRADLEEAVKLAPHNVEVLRSQGMFLLQQNELDAALTVLDAALALNDDQPDTHEARGVALFLLKRYDDAMKSFDRVIDLAPGSPVVYTHRARVHALTQHYPEALTELDKSLEIDPDFPLALLLRARIYLQIGDTAKALADVNGVLRKDEDQPQARQLHALLLAGNGKLSEAIEDLEQLRLKDPDDAEMLLQLGMFYTADQKPAKAVEAYTKLISNDPQNLAAYRGRGDAYLNMSKQAEAIADYNAALKIEPENSGVLNNLAWVLATSTDDKLRDGARSIELGTLACKLTDYKQAHILSTLAAGYAETGDFETAKSWSRKAVELGADGLKEQLGKELASYEAGKPWREALPPIDFEVDDQPESADTKAPTGKDDEERAAEESAAKDATSKAPGKVRQR